MGTYEITVLSDGTVFPYNDFKIPPKIPMYDICFLFWNFIGDVSDSAFLLCLYFHSWQKYFILDIGTFILSIVTAFWFSYKLTLSCRLEPYTSLLCILVCILLVCFWVFTYRPPDAALFQDPTISGKIKQRVMEI